MYYVWLKDLCTHVDVVDALTTMAGMATQTATVVGVSAVRYKFNTECNPAASLCFLLATDPGVTTPDICIFVRDSGTTQTCVDRSITNALSRKRKEQCPSVATLTFVDDDESVVMFETISQNGVDIMNCNISINKTNSADVACGNVYRLNSLLFKLLDGYLTNVRSHDND